MNDAIKIGNLLYIPSLGISIDLYFAAIDFVKPVEMATIMENNRDKKVILNNTEIMELRDYVKFYKRYRSLLENMKDKFETKNIIL